MKKTLLHLCALVTLTLGFVSFTGCAGEAPKKAEETPATEQPATQPAATQPADTAHQHAPGDTTHKH
ncbi:MAG: hypothetical protein IT273_05030 [Chitinophagales bacterium]|nr:hypothetical protein [Chitinophagales bacterium]